MLGPSLSLSTFIGLGLFFTLWWNLNISRSARQVRPVPLRVLGSDSSAKSPPSGFPSETAIFNSTLGFGDILVLSLPYRTDHRDSTTLAASFTNLTVAFIDGILPSEVQNKTIPPGAPRTAVGEGSIASWRGHLNAVSTMIQRGLATALILEDDVDWDIDIKQQMYNYSLGVRTLTQPVSLHSGTYQQRGGISHGAVSTSSDQGSTNAEEYADPTFDILRRRPLITEEEARANLSFYTSEALWINSSDAPETLPPSTSPYGDNWDVLWLGHCGCTFPPPPSLATPALPTEEYDEASESDPSIFVPQGRYIMHADRTCPAHKNIAQLTPEHYEKYPQFTRVMHHAWGRTICSHAYAVSLAGARKILYNLGLKQFRGPFDLSLAELCEDASMVCLTSQPALMGHYRMAGSTDRDSDIDALSAGWAGHKAGEEEKEDDDDGEDDAEWREKSKEEERRKKKQKEEQEKDDDWREQPVSVDVLRGVKWNLDRLVDGATAEPQWVDERVAEDDMLREEAAQGYEELDEQGTAKRRLRLW